ncbi:MAG: aspartate/glutamate racemase family protein [Solirubrobacterales bacterium]
MRPIGLIGGMSWESSAEYYRLINEDVRARLGGMHSAACVLYSFDFAEVEALQRAGDWERAGGLLADAAGALERAGAGLLVLCTNTMHRLAPEVEAAAEIPLVHIADPTAEAALAAETETVGLVGTRYTMEGEFYRRRLEERHGLRVLIPDEPDRSAIHEIIYDELVVGQLREESRRRYAIAIEDLIGRGAQAIILGCTEIGLLVGPEDASVPILDTTILHARAAVTLALEMS